MHLRSHSSASPPPCPTDRPADTDLSSPGLLSSSPLRRSRVGLTSLILIVAGACAPPAAEPASERGAQGQAPDVDVERTAVDAVLTDLHTLASAGDFERYFQLFTEDAVFMGTDATERWSVDDFRGYAAASDGWTYQMTERHIFLDDDADTAWFDERLENANYGETRGTGVLVRTPDGWKIAQYNLTIPIPNELAREFVARITETEGR